MLKLKNKLFQQTLKENIESEAVVDLVIFLDSDQDAMISEQHHLIVGGRL